MSDDQLSQAQTDQKKYDDLAVAIRDLIKHENDLVNQRIGWLVQTQGLLFAALAFAWEKAPKLSYILSGVGIATAISIASAIALYSPTVRRLNALWLERAPEAERLHRPINGDAPPSTGVLKMLRPWRALPFVFVSTWAAVVLIKLFA
jgi:hypothetical protein